MERYRVSVQLNALPKARVLNVNMGDNDIQKCLVIPISENMPMNEKGDIYLELVAYPKKKMGKKGQTHGLKMLLDQEAYKIMKKEEIYAMPFVGSMYVFTPQPTLAAVPTSPVEIQQYVQTADLSWDDSENTTSEDLPF